MKKNYFFAIATIFLVQLFSSCNSDDVLVTENKRMAVFATLLDDNNVALQDIPVNVTTNFYEEYNILGASSSKARGRVDFVSLVSYNRGVNINFNPVSSADYNPNFTTVSYIDPREIADREDHINLDLVKLSAVQGVNVSITRLPQTDNLDVQIQYYKKEQFFPLNERVDPLMIPENVFSDYVRLNEENPAFENTLDLPVGAPVKIFYSVNDGVEKDSTIMVTSSTSSVNLEF